VSIAQLTQVFAVFMQTICPNYTFMGIANTSRTIRHIGFEATCRTEEMYPESDVQQRKVQ